MSTLLMLLLSAGFLLLSGGLMLLFRSYSAFFFPAYRTFSAALMRGISAVTGPIPFAVWELCLLLLIAVFLIAIIRNIKKLKKLLRCLAALILLVCSLTLTFVVFWGLNHYAPPISEYWNLELRGHTEEELLEATRYYMAQAEACAEEVSRNYDGTISLPEFSVMAEEAGTAFLPLADACPLFENGSTAPVKEALLTSAPMSYSGTTGIIIAWTAESTVNPDTYPVSLCHTMCHEVAHRYGIGGEDEANFAAFLACTESEEVYFRYSGYYSAFVYCYNALYKANPQAASGLWDDSNELLYRDCTGANEHYDQYRGPVQDAAQKANDTYLKAFSEESGVESYGEAADYLLAWYLQEIKVQ